MKYIEKIKDLFENFDGDLRAKFIEQFPEVWDDAYDIDMGSRYHRLMTSCMLAGWFAAVKAMKEREQILVEALEKAEKRFSHIENWHRDFVTPDNFKDCQDVGQSPESYLRDGKNEIREALKKYRGSV